MNSIKRQFNSLNSAISYADDSLGTSNLVSGNYILNLACYADGSDGTKVAVNGYIADVTHYMRIFTPSLESEVGVSQRHTGVVGTGYRIVADPGDWGYIMNIDDDYLRLEGLSLRNTGTLNCYGIYSTGEKGIRLDKCLVSGCTRQSITIMDAGGTGAATDACYITNCLVYNTTHIGIYFSGLSNYSNCYNTTVINSGFDAFKVSDAVSAGLIKMKNCYGHTKDGSNCFYLGAGGRGNISNCMSEDATGNIINRVPSTGSPTYFMNVVGGAEDAHIGSCSALRDQGADLSTVFSDDVDGQTRSDMWDIGADEKE